MRLSISIKLSGWLHEAQVSNLQVIDQKLSSNPTPFLESLSANLFAKFFIEIKKEVLDVC